MAELLPQSLSASMHDDEGSSKESKKRIQNHKVTTITTWVECFATYINLVFMRSLERVPDLLAYSPCSQAVPTGPVAGIRHYLQTAGRCQQRLEVGSDPYLSLDNGSHKCSTQPHCSHCLSLDHTSVQCPENKVTDKKSQPEKEQIYPICNRFNRGECKSSSCKFRHQCEICEKNHPETECPSLKRYRPYNTNFKGQRNNRNTQGNNRDTRGYKSKSFRSPEQGKGTE